MIDSLITIRIVKTEEELNKQFSTGKQILEEEGYTISPESWINLSTLRAYVYSVDKDKNFIREYIIKPGFY